MGNPEHYYEQLSGISGKVIAIVYIFEGEDAPGFKHYDIWRGDLIGEWIQAVQELHCLPLIFDTRTFVQKAMDNTLPKVDYIVNLNNGTIDVCTLGLIPSVCSFLSIPCIPCNTVSQVVGEHKLLSNLIAYAKKINIPEELKRTEKNGILRPLTYGSSYGIKRIRETVQNTEDQECLYQKFIPGFDMTTPIMFNPLTMHLEVLPAIMYYPTSNDIEWYLGENEKNHHTGYEKRLIQISNAAKEKYLQIAEAFLIKTYCRIDARVYCESINEIPELLNTKVPLDRIFFLEINPTPTIKKNINFHTSIENINNDNKLHICHELYQQKVKNGSITGFILSCSIISLL